MIGIVKLPIGNLQSAWNAVYENGFDPVMVQGTEVFDDLSHLILPGVGHFKAVMESLEARSLITGIRSFAASGRPVLGICIGMQLLASVGTEGEPTEGLDLVPGTVVKLSPGDDKRVPHVGWNSVELKARHPVFEGIKANRDFYFVHSYAFRVEEPCNSIGETEYGRSFTSVVSRKNILGVQFHPEKSQINGLRLLENFCRWDGTC